MDILPQLALVFGPPALLMLCGALFLHGAWAVAHGRVYGKGRWYTRSDASFAPTVALYLLGCPTVAFACLDAAWRV